MTVKMWKIIAVGVVVLVGWVLNIISLINLAITGSPITLLVLLKIVGIFIPPLGALLGYFF